MCCLILLRPPAASLYPGCAPSLARTDHNSILEDSMPRSFRAVALAALFLAAASAAQAQAPAPAAHVVIVKMVEVSSTKYAFQPAAVTVEPGDTLRFVQASTVPHNVSFRSHPNGAKLGDAAVGPYLTNQGETYNLVIDGRFPAGTYKFACDPHEMMGMTGVLTVHGR